MDSGVFSDKENIYLYTERLSYRFGTMEGSRTCRIYNKMENKARVVIDGGQKVKLSNQSILSPLYLEMVQKWKKQKQKTVKK